MTLPPNPPIQLLRPPGRDGTFSAAKKAKQGRMEPTETPTEGTTQPTLTTHPAHNEPIIIIQINNTGRQKARFQNNRIWLRRRVMKSYLSAFEKALAASEILTISIIVDIVGFSLAKNQG
jgi:hypothetical protein